MTEKLPEYKIFAIKYATREARRADHFIGGDPHDGPMPMDYFTWVIVGPDRVFLVDTGFTAETAARRKRTFLRCPIESLRRVDIDPDAVTDVILTHLHYDHVGNFRKLPHARFHLQERELAFATGRYVRYPYFGHGFEEEDIVGIVRLNFKRQLELYDGDMELAPGLTLHFAPGHTAGLQVVRVNTQRGRVVLASDASHYYENIRTNRPFIAVVDISAMLDAFRKVERLADSAQHIIPGHDPLVMRQYPALSPSLQDIVVRLDVDPVE
ncbi:MAG TPA: N-acyl homoserine lactonase family protein [Methylomirabilota bacterium]|jgi:glyoxylase-like metal-dependent hydrolase (beta-lactamase superfamily II)|nr:N-acyl homoserine lactonase family protein [Methylomirabilota bacterium]